CTRVCCPRSWAVWPHGRWWPPAECRSAVGVGDQVGEVGEVDFGEAGGQSQFGSWWQVGAVGDGEHDGAGGEGAGGAGGGVFDGDAPVDGDTESFGGGEVGLGVGFGVGDFVAADDGVEVVSAEGAQGYVGQRAGGGGDQCGG